MSSSALSDYSSMISPRSKLSPEEAPLASGVIPVVTALFNGALFATSRALTCDGDTSDARRDLLVVPGEEVVGSLREGSPDFGFIVLA